MVYRSRAKATETRVSTGNLSTGIYILRIDTEKEIFKKKLQVQK
ncbi:MAG: T9SS type A sorting domain-containing protein [Bacteroidales bacterium]|nr:T9SS type A sorting domain-containing protein [Bacteroidales bacterium]MCF8338606.1 T9SS type A sorting domain-containing protein [Bacteroidales bacterium]